MISEELKRRLQENLLFEDATEDQKPEIIGAINILIKNETPESAEELFQALRSLIKELP